MDAAEMSEDFESAKAIYGTIKELLGQPIAQAEELAKKIKTIDPTEPDIAKLHDIIEKRSDLIVDGLVKYKEFKTTNDPDLEKKSTASFNEAGHLLETFMTERKKFEKSHNVVIEDK